MSSMPPAGGLLEGRAGTFPAPSNLMLPIQVVIPRLVGFPVGAEIMKTYWPFRDAFEATPVINTGDGLAFFVESVTEVAVRVTVPPLGTEAGAV